MESVEPHLNGLKAIYAIALNLQKLMKLNPVWKLLHVEFPRVRRSGHW